MSPTKVLLAALCMGMGALAFADDPTPPATTSATAPASTDTASPAAADSAAADKAAADKAAADKAAADKAKATGPGGVTSDQAKTLRIAGYKANVQRGGEVLYCRSEPKPYSLLEEKVCGRPDDILLTIANSKEQVKQMQRANH
jgi:colicin import membrane protein